jgi:hypothetical protein
MVKFVNEADNIATIPFTKEQMGWILTHMKLTRKGKKLAKQLRRWTK